jgi:hypothetical protein
MSKSQHTPELYVARPDTVRGQGPRIHDYMPTIRLQDGGHELAIVTLNGRKQGERSQAEWANLFAVAPELLAALEDLLDAPDLNVDEMEPLTRQYIEEARAAVAKTKSAA